MMHRRQFLLSGLALATFTTLGIVTWHDSFGANLTNRTLVLSAILPALLHGALPADPVLNRAALVRTTQATLDFMAFLPARQQQQLDQLFNLLANRLSRLGVTGYWLALETLPLTERLALLNRWRDSYIRLLQQAYHGLRELLYGAYYGQPEHWVPLNYQAPRFR